MVGRGLGLALLIAAQAFAADVSGLPQAVQGTVTANPSLPTSATLSNVSASASSTSILSSNTSRRGAMVFNDSTAVLYLKFGTSASTTSFTVQIGAFGYFELPQPIYTGALTAVWASATGTARVTELTP